jgi:NAD(P)-dependent dehydrogenase (short-subunit alcohol dehydrogenase family)
MLGSLTRRLVERVVKTNLIASSYCVQEALILLRVWVQRPHLVGVASSVAFLPLTRSEAYGASKAGLRYLFQSLRIDLAQEGIDVTIVSPGFVDTPLTAKNDFADANALVRTESRRLTSPSGLRKHVAHWKFLSRCPSS